MRKGADGKEIVSGEGRDIDCKLATRDEHEAIRGEASESHVGLASWT
jgi:hypothetical protein